MHCIGVNSSFCLGDWVDICLFGDARWFNLEYGALRGFSGLVVGISPFQDHGEIGQTVGVTVRLMRRSRKGKGLTTRPGELCWNHSSGGAAVNLAVQLGAKKVILIGYDMRAIEGEHNFHDKYPWNKDRPYRDPYRIHGKPWKMIAVRANKMEVEIINATPGSTIDAFPIMTLEEACQK
jgi:hypothetical protein